MDNLGSRIRKIRKGLKLNQLDFALKIGLKSATAISKYEDNTREPEIDILIKISNLGNISIDELVKGEYFEEDFKKGDQLGGRSYIKDNSALYGSPDALFTSDQNINIEEAIGKTYKVLSAGTDLSVALYMNIQQFAAALDTGQALKLCQDQMKDMQEKVDVLTRKVDALTAPSIAERQGDGSEKEAI